MRHERELVLPRRQRVFRYRHSDQHGADMTVQYLVGDTREVIAKIPDGSVSLVATSPPFYHLRSYLQGDHADKGNEIGSELSVADFLDTLLELTAEWWRVLAPWGSIAVELGDTYSGSGGPGGDYNEGGLREGQGKFVGSARAQRNGTGMKARPKSLACIPQLYAIALAYGINPLTGKESPAGKCLVRNVICWHRPNPAVGALGDKVRPSTSYIVVATRSAKRWFDLTAVRETPKPHSLKYDAARKLSPGSGYVVETRGDGGRITGDMNPAGAPPLDAWFDEHDFHDTWTLTTQPSSLAHYAMWPAKLAERLILMMCPLAVCRVCGEPRRRASGFDYQPRLAAHIKERREACGYTSSDLNGWFGYKEIAKNWERTDKHGAAIPNPTDWPILKARLDLSDEYDAVVMGDRHWKAGPADYVAGNGSTHSGIDRDPTKNIANGHGGHSGKRDGATTRVERSRGWTDCGHDDYRPGLVLDPFAGTGTTLAVADLHGRDAIGIDIDERNRDIYPARYDEVKRALYGTPPPMPGQEAFDFAI